MPAFGHGSCIVCLTSNATKTVKWTVGTQTATPETIDAKVCNKCAELIADTQPGPDVDPAYEAHVAEEQAAMEAAGCPELNATEDPISGLTGYGYRPCQCAYHKQFAN